MAAKSGKNAGISILAPNGIGTNRETDFLKLLAILTMLIDHSGKMLFPQYRIMRIIGRLSFPIFAYCIAVGCVYTKSTIKYMERVLFMGLISQPLYAVSMAHSCDAMYSIAFKENPILAVLNFYVNSFKKPSIFFSLLFGIAVIWSIREKRFVFTIGLAVLLFKIQGSLDYGWWGIGLILLFYLTCTNSLATLLAVSAYILWWGFQSSGYQLFGFTFGIETFAVLAMPLICIPTKTGIKLNKWVFYWFYPLHLILIYILDRFVV